MSHEARLCSIKQVKTIRVLVFHCCIAAPSYSTRISFHEVRLKSGSTGSSFPTDFAK